jgi:hypothetical protein
MMQADVLSDDDRVTNTPQKITFDDKRASCVRDVLIYCCDHRCSDHVEINAERWPDDLGLSDVEPGFVCTACGKRGADGAHGHRLMPRAAGRLSGFIEPCLPSEGPTAQTPAPPS